MFKSVKLFFVFLYVIIPNFLYSQDVSVQTKPKLAIEQIMQDPKWTGEVSSTIWWSEDGKQIYFKWNPGDAKAESTYVANKDGTGLRKLTLEERKNLIPDQGDYNKAKTKKVYTKNNDIYLVDIPSMEISQLTNTTERESSPEFSFDEKKVLFIRNSNLYSVDLETGLLTQLTDFRQGDKPKDKSKTDREKWLEKEELSLIQILRERKEEKERKKKTKSC
ncbi:MAG: DPP IV N-terminal domain-containing protein [Melioribacteraceae bacterium]|nr:DPP IV N-terminal domain-containing protein [Melioribacteraceae bacterium]